MGTVCHLRRLEARTTIGNTFKNYGRSIAENFAMVDNQDSRPGFPNVEELPMETRRENRPVSITDAGRLLRLDMTLPYTRSARPCARDPPSPHRKELPTLPAGPTAGAPWQTR
jgi:hypothetical protein